MKKLNSETEKKLNAFQLDMHEVPTSFTKKLHNIPYQLNLNRKESKRLIIWAAASCILLLGMHFFALKDTLNKQQSAAFVSTYFDYLNSTP